MGARRWSVLRKSRVAAFTLLECLLALLVVSGSLLVYDGLAKLIVHEVRYQENQTETNWVLFCDQLRSEWADATLDKVEEQRLYLTKGIRRHSYGKLSANDFRKMGASGSGYQPMLYGIQSATFSRTENIVRLDIKFENGQERSFVYAFEETG